MVHSRILSATVGSTGEWSIGAEIRPYRFAQHKECHADRWEASHFLRALVQLLTVDAVGPRE